jgi:acetyltransferase-like isoleucine patch superfamily enzyme
MGNIKVGKNCKLQNFDVYISEPTDKVTYITIGDNCMISGNFTLYGKNAKIKIGNDVFIGQDTKLFCRDQITIGNNIMISWSCTLIDTNAHSLKSNERLNDVKDWMKGEKYKNWNIVETKSIHVEDYSWIGFNSIITKGVIVKEGSVIGCGSVLTKSTEAYGVYGGNPAVQLKKTE